MELLFALDHDNANIQPEKPIREIGGVFNRGDSFLMKRYRMPRHVLEDLTTKLRDDLLANNRGQNIPPDVQVACALRVLSEGNFQRPTGDTVGASQPTVSRILHRFCDALLATHQDAIRFPRNA